MTPGHSNLVKCTRCQWRGIPTFIKGNPRDECPYCKAPVEPLS